MVRALLIRLGEITWHEYIFYTHRGSLTAPHDLGVVGVIDGQTLKITPFRTANVPPPMAMFEVESESSIIDVVFAPDNAGFWVLHHGGVDAYSLGTKDGRCLAPKFVRRFALNGDRAKVPLQLSVTGDNGVHILAVGEESILISSHASEPESDKAVAHAIEVDAVSSIGQYTVGGSPTTLAQEHSGKLLQVSLDSTVALPVSFPMYLSWTEVTEHDGQLLAFGLSSGGHLYVNSRQLVKNCSSFLVTPSHLIFTTSNHLLKFAHLDRPEGMIMELFALVQKC